LDGWRFETYLYGIMIIAGKEKRIDTLQASPPVFGLLDIDGCMGKVAFHINAEQVWRSAVLLPMVQAIEAGKFASARSVCIRYI
jgi:hypothetical protein